MMRILVLGAGAIGGYFGARLVQAGADVQFLVRERRAAQLRDRGLVVRSSHGDFEVPATPVLQAELRTPVDLVLLACKAYDLDSAIESIRPAVGASTTVLPLLNGVAHIERLQQVFGEQAIAGGSCAIPATLNAQGEVVQMSPLHRIAVGRLPGTAPGAGDKLEQLATLFRRTPVDAVLVPDMWQELWEKFAGLATIATMTCLMRASIGDIVATEEGAALTRETYEACARVAEAAGHAPRAASRASYLALLQQPGSTLTASMLRDVESGGRSEGAHIIGDMFHRARAAGIDAGGLRPAWCHMQAYEQRRLREAGAPSGARQVAVAGVTREALPDGSVRLASARCSFTYRRLRPGALLVTISGVDDGQFGPMSLDEIRVHLLDHRPLELFVDAQAAVAVMVEASKEWTHFFAANRSRLKRVSVLAGTRAVELSVAIAQHLSQTGDLIQIYTDRALFEERLGRA